MDQVKIGKFIAALRRQNGMTQDALGTRLGVTNKTVSRWENGNYMPDIEMMQMLAKELDISINELLAGEKLSDEDFRIKADENIVEAVKSSTFSFEEKKNYFKNKWRKEHIMLFIILFIIFVAAIIIPIIVHKPWFAGLAPLIAMVEYGYQNNKMMIDVEKNLYND